MEAPVRKEKTHFTVKLTEVNATEKVKLIKEVKNCIQGLNLVQVRRLTVAPFLLSVGVCLCCFMVQMGEQSLL